MNKSKDFLLKRKAELEKKIKCLSELQSELSEINKMLESCEPTHNSMCEGCEGCDSCRKGMRYR